jgi:muconate cycloisomerase
MVTIEKIETIHVAVPTRRVHKWAGLSEAIGGYVLVRVSGDNGLAGWGEAPVLKDWGGDYGRYFGETPDTTRIVIDNHLAPAVTGADIANIVELHERMDKAIRGYPYAKAAVEMATYDLLGRTLGVPVYTLLGGLARSAIPVTHSIGLLAIDEAVTECVKVVDEGIKTIKLKVGVLPARDVDIVREVRSAIGDGIELCIDANGGYDSPAEAVRVFRSFESYGIKYFEQPVVGITGLAKVSQAIDVPVMADESAWNVNDVIDIVRCQAAEIVSIYTTKPGGLYNAMQVGAVARAAGLRCNVNGSVELGVGNLANIHLAAASPAVTLSCVVPVSTPAEAQKGQVAGIYYTDDLITEPFVFADGAIRVPNGPGFGIDVSLDKVDRYRVRSPS